MSTPSLVLAVTFAALLAVGARAAEPGPGLGRPVSPENLVAMDLTIWPDGTGLPPGKGSVTRGAVVYAEQCEACHGARGAGGVDGNPRLTGGIGSLASPTPLKTVTSYWPHAPGVFDYVRRAMPPMAPGALSDDETYAVTAYLLSVDGIVPAKAQLDRKSLPKVRMPNADGFVTAPR